MTWRLLHSNCCGPSFVLVDSEKGASELIIEKIGDICINVVGSIIVFFRSELSWSPLRRGSVLGGLCWGSFAYHASIIRRIPEVESSVVKTTASEPQCDSLCATWPVDHSQHNVWCCNYSSSKIEGACWAGTVQRERREPRTSWILTTARWYFAKKGFEMCTSVVSPQCPVAVYLATISACGIFIIIVASPRAHVPIELPSILIDSLSVEDMALKVCWIS